MAWGEFAGDSVVASRKQGPPCEIDASLGSSLIYAFITVNNASPFTSGLSCHSFSHACLPIYPTPVYLVPHLTVIYSARAIPSRAKLFVPLKATLFPRCILKRLVSTPLRLCLPPSCCLLRLDPRCCLLVLINVKKNKISNKTS